ncbi:glutamate--tRNA ligase [Acetobacter peroxydans]|uniref:Glutamate--tRNA ligase n=1 Tax=Acetobacter peroxydans TaxID=104098 RepID=A0A4Y3TW31_9PROT|nr:glutamate--tRNA ligase [Acetobacter peroxydans]MCH4142880.1 glutamate--tRNA ligase [Acetobacter peroxydans]MCI1395459.1 glutamate--tRNA ligase [Acetobacter peroxydans]MCI1410560.1 glutamate--tRNA ligase [Acetobacter peroxydans]MCI1440312.1 glutamate--tRNA ligase [Acetobacter peroxydans]MCI1565539.1 glutamate--tRNA ligase [Acetobacter peroxydans]
MSIRTRFAPSPTGLLHIGNARAALFNFLFARHHGGKFLLRIEDTDRERSTQQAVDVIFAGLEWMGITPDEEPVFQSTRADRHREVALELLERGLAYKCYCTPEELAQMREDATKNGLPPRYNGLWRDRDPAEAPAGAPFAVRIKAPREGETVINDLVQGEVRVANAEMDDMIILRSDGTPTYQHAVVVDDHDMAITHVIRGDDHLTNTFRQAMIYRAMGWDLPRFGHLPLIHGPDGAKLSKRHGAQSVVEFRDQGYLPEALCNYLLRLGWGHGDAEILSREEQIHLFDIDGVGRAPSRMDYAKLEHINAVWLRQADDTRLTDDVMERLKAVDGVEVDETTRARVLALMPGLKDRARTLVELTDNAAFLGRRVPLPFNAKAEKLLTPEARTLLSELARDLAVVSPFTAENIDAALRRFAEAGGHKLGSVAQPLRAAVTGSNSSPGIDATLHALGRDEVLARIGAVLHG